MDLNNYHNLQTVVVPRGDSILLPSKIRRPKNLLPISNQHYKLLRVCVYAYMCVLGSSVDRSQQEENEGEVVGVWCVCAWELLLVY